MCRDLVEELASDSLFAIFALLTVSFMWDLPYILTFVLIAGSALMLLKNRDPVEYGLYLLVALLGAGAEVFAISLGAWIYTEPQLIGIPLWLPFLWGMAGVYVNRISGSLDRFWINTEKGIE